MTQGTLTGAATATMLLVWIGWLMWVDNSAPSKSLVFSAPNAKIADVWLPPEKTGAEPSPLIVFVPGWRGVRTDNRALVRGLLRRGFAVVAIDDVAQDPALDDPADEAARTAPYDLSSDSAAAKFIAAADRRIVFQARQVTGLLDAIAADAELRARINLGRAGILGYSFGGATAVLAARQEPRLKAIVNLDGWQFGPSADDVIEKPFLVINSMESGFTPQSLTARDATARHEALLNLKEQTWQMRQVSARKDADRLLLAGASHSDLADGLGNFRRWLKSWLRLWSTHPSQVNARMARAALDDVTASFFDRYLRDISRELKSVISAHPVLLDLGVDRVPCDNVADRCALPPNG